MATCKMPIDINDPTGCGGHCIGQNKLCRSLGAGAFQCVDASSKLPIHSLFISIIHHNIHFNHYRMSPRRMAM